MTAASASAATPVAPRSAPWLALAGGALLALAMPGMLPALGPVLVLPGLMAFYALITASRRPIRDSYLFGCVFMAGFSWSVHHVMIAAYVAIVLVGGLYFALVACSLRRVRCCRALAFGASTAAVFWLRAVMPEIYYPHGQPAHALFEWPMLLMGGIALGGEALVNAMLGVVAAVAVDGWRGWRLGVPDFAVARRRLLLAVGVVVLLSLVGAWSRTAPPQSGEVRVVVIEPGLHPMDPYAGLGPAAAQRRLQQLTEKRLLAPTRAVLQAPDPPDLVLWPESALPMEVRTVSDLEAGRARLVLPGPWPAVATRLLLGASALRDGAHVPAALLLDPASGVILGHHEKLRRVPGGEFVPLAGLLPDALAASVREAFQTALGAPPDCGVGVAQPLLETAAGARFGALICYDNAFAGPARDLVGQGAEFLVVLSNEAWYRGGAELDQLVAMTVCRALETGVPIVRCTTDGWSVAVDRDGRIRAGLPRQPAPTPEARILAVKLQLGPAADTPMAWLRGWIGALLALWLGIAVLHGLAPWARLPVTRKVA